MHSLFLILRLARCELRGDRQGLWTFFACLALGVATVAAVGSVAAAVHSGLRTQARTLLGGDLLVERTHLALPEEVTALLATSGTIVPYARARIMARGETSSTLTALKAVGSGYPLYGAVVTDPPLSTSKPLAEVLQYTQGQWGAVADKELLVRLNKKTGQTVQVGTASYRIVAELVREPDRTGQFFGIAPRLLVHHDSLPATGLLQPGNLIRRGVAVRFSGSASGAQVKKFAEELSRRFPDAGLRVRQFSNAGGGIRRFMDILTLYLTLPGLVALLLGGIGVAGAVRAFLEKRMVHIAVMKSLGASRLFITTAYLTQVGIVALAGSSAGALLGWLGASYIAQPLAVRLALPVAAGVQWLPLGIAVLYGLLTALIFSLWPLSAAGSVSPVRLFRGYAQHNAVRPSRLAVGGTLCAVCCVLILLWQTSGDIQVTAGFAASLIVCALVYRTFILLLTAVARRLPRPENPRLRHALAALYRPGSSAPGVIFSVGLGLTVLTTLALVDGNLQDQIRRQTPQTAPAFLLWDVRQDTMPVLEQQVLSLPGVVKTEKRPSIRGRIVAINGVPADPANVAPDAAWALRSDRGLTFAAAMPEKIQLRTGKWWESDYNGPPVVCMDHAIARGFGIGIGDKLTLTVLGRRLVATIVATRDIDWSDGGLNHVLIFGPGVLEKAPYTYLGAIYLEKNHTQQTQAAVFRLLTKNFPDTPVIPMETIIEDITRIIEDIGLAIRITAAAALLAGLLALAQTMNTTMRLRYRDAVIFKVLGATRRDSMLTLVLEFIVSGLIASVLAAALACPGAWLFVTFVLKGNWVLLPQILIGLPLTGALTTALLGLLGVYRVLGHKAWPVLRNE